MNPSVRMSFSLPDPGKETEQREREGKAKNNKGEVTSHSMKFWTLVTILLRSGRSGGYRGQERILSPRSLLWAPNPLIRSLLGSKPSSAAATSSRRSGLLLHIGRRHGAHRRRRHLRQTQQTKPLPLISDGATPPRCQSTLPPRPEALDDDAPP